MSHVTSKYLGWSVSPSEGQFTAEVPWPRWAVRSGQTEVRGGEGSGPGLPAAVPNGNAPVVRGAFHLATQQQGPWKSRCWLYKQEALVTARPALDHCFLLSLQSPESQPQSQVR